MALARANDFVDDGVESSVEKSAAWRRRDGVRCRLFSGSSGVVVGVPDASHTLCWRTCERDGHPNSAKGEGGADSSLGSEKGDAVFGAGCGRGCGALSSWSCRSHWVVVSVSPTMGLKSGEGGAMWGPVQDPSPESEERDAVDNVGCRRWCGALPSWSCGIAEAGEGNGIATSAPTLGVAESTEVAAVGIGSVVSGEVAAVGITGASSPASVLGISGGCTWRGASSSAADTLAAATTSLCPPPFHEVDRI